MYKEISANQTNTHTEHVWIKLKKLDLKYRKKWTRNITRERISQVLL